MAYIGRDIQYGTFTTKQTLTADSSTTVFTLTQGVADANNLLVSIGGIVQEANTAYTAVGTVLTFASAPVTGDPVWVVYLGKEASSAGVARDSITYQTGVGDGTTTPFALSSSVTTSSSIIVTLNGVEQVPGTDFTAYGTVLTFTTAPDATDAILIYYIASLAVEIATPANTSITTAKLSGTFSGTLPAWNGAALTGLLSKTLLDEINTNIALVAFLRSTDHNKSVLNMMDAFIDQFEDQTGVDDTNSVNELYDTTDDYYSPSFTVNAPDSIPDMTANTSPSGTALASTENAGSNAAWIAMSNDSANSWVTTTPNTTGFLQFGFNNGQSAKIIKRYIIEGQTGQSTRAPKNWTFKGSNDGSTFTTLDTQTNQSFSSGERKTYNDFTNTTSYVFYRLDITANNGSTSVSIQEFELYVDKFANTYHDMTLISESKTADASPDTARVSLFNEEVDALTVNTDIMAWASRSKQTITSDFATDNKLDATTHGLENDGRVVLTNNGTFLATMVDFDGTAAGLEKSTDLVGNANSKVGVMFARVKFTGNDNTEALLIRNSSSRFKFAKSSSNKILVQMTNTSAVDVFDGSSTNTYTDPSETLNILISWDTASSKFEMYINDTLEIMTISTPMLTNSLIDYTSASWGIGKHPSNSSTYLNGELGQVYLDITNTLDLSVDSNRRLFTKSDGRPLDLTSVGSPIIYLNNTLATWEQNLGSGGDFTKVGTLTAGTDISDGALPTGLDTETAYYVVNKTANDLELSLTSGGAAVSLTDDGTGTHSILAVSQATLTDQGDYGTGKATLTGTADISGQPTGTDMSLIVQTKNTKETKLHGMALQYR